jgi:hypothetical protein
VRGDAREAGRHAGRHEGPDLGTGPRQHHRHVRRVGGHERCHRTRRDDPVDDEDDGVRPRSGRGGRVERMHGLDGEPCRRKSSAHGVAVRPRHILGGV